MWIKSIENHFWWPCATCEGDAQMLQERRISVFFHIQNKHIWTGHEKFQKCVHSRLTKKSDAFEALQNIVWIRKY